MSEFLSRDEIDALLDIAEEAERLENELKLEKQLYINKGYKMKIFTAYQYLDIENIDSDDEILIDILDNIISLEFAIFHMRNTALPKHCDGYNIDILRNLRESFISTLQADFDLKYIEHNNFGD